MKKLAVVLLFAFSLASIAHAETIPMLYSDPVVPMVISDSVDEPMMCTMDYTPVCGVTGITYGNACSAGKNKIAYLGECNSFVDNVAYAELESTKIITLKRQLSKYSDARLLSVLESIDQRIEMVKLSRITKEMQVQKITLYTFIKNTIPKVLSMR